jgi:hypothetical protein
MDRDKRECLLCGQTYADSKAVSDYLRRQALRIFNLALQCRKQSGGGWLVSVCHRKRRRKGRKRRNRYPGPSERIKRKPRANVEARNAHPCGTFICGSFLGRPRDRLAGHSSAASFHFSAVSGAMNECKCDGNAPAISGGSSSPARMKRPSDTQFTLSFKSGRESVLPCKCRRRAVAP